VSSPKWESRIYKCGNTEIPYTQLQVGNFVFIVSSADSPFDLDMCHCSMPYCGQIIGVNIAQIPFEEIPQALREFGWTDLRETNSHLQLVGMKFLCIEHTAWAKEYGLLEK